MRTPEYFKAPETTMGLRFRGKVQALRAKVWDLNMGVPRAVGLRRQSYVSCKVLMTEVGVTPKP